MSRLNDLETFDDRCVSRLEGLCG